MKPADRLKKLIRQLPPVEEVLRGSVVRRRLRCGRAGCHCAQDAGHPVTHLVVTHRGGRTEQISLPESLVDQAERWVANYRAWRDALEQVSAVNRDRLREARAAVRSARPRRGS